MKKKSSVLIGLLVFITLLTSCGQSELTEDPINTVNLVDKSESKFVTPSFNQRYILESFKESVKTNRVQVLKSNERLLEVLIKEDDQEIIATLEAELTGEGLIKTLSLNGYPIEGDEGKYFITAYNKIGSSYDLPDVVKLDIKNSEVASPIFVGIKTMDYLKLFLRENIIIDGLYSFDRDLVNALITQRILQKDSLVEYIVTDNTIYAVMSVYDREDEYYLIWHDGSQMTLAGNVRFNKGVDY